MNNIKVAGIIGNVSDGLLETAEFLSGQGFNLYGSDTLLRRGDAATRHLLNLCSEQPTDRGYGELQFLTEVRRTINRGWPEHFIERHEDEKVAIIGLDKEMTLVEINSTAESKIIALSPRQPEIWLRDSLLGTTQYGPNLPRCREIAAIKGSTIDSTPIVYREFTELDFIINHSDDSFSQRTV